VDHIDDHVGSGGEFIGVIVARRVAAEVAVSVVVVMVMMGTGGKSLGGGLSVKISPSNIVSTLSANGRATGKMPLSSLEI
jgi:hypothetical protein